MNYKAILKYLAEKENVSVQEIENEMQYAVNFADLDCSAEEFIKTVSIVIKDYI